ncbi:Uu.00g091220.m01.CDS01 [Anthostomella pinea]|uniref:Uu.00g091220.m01.CDS01 n=1 Tax=Anthostomella pinea TaxID=933095 RepID=A0AAI8YK84_9PEZI|nr:Uu.00g091220.m01.CDS01 [Anthostomella pinea]
MTESPVELRIAHQAELHRAVLQTTRIYPELDRYRDVRLPPSRDGPSRDVLYRLATEDLPPPTPQFSGSSSHSQLSFLSASPSTKFSESPGPSPYSRDTTPTSMSSQSPGLVAPIRFSPARVRQTSPAETRPPVTRRRTGSTSNDSDAFGVDHSGLAVVREVLTSSSSNSTVRTDNQKENKARRGRSPTPPNPPPRKSSQKLKKDRDVGEVRSPSKASQRPTQSVMRSLSPTKIAQPPRDRTPDVFTSPQRRPTPPSRPSRDGTPDLYSQFGGPVPIGHSNLSSTSLTERRQSGQLAPSSLPRSTTPSSNQNRSTSAKAPVNREPTPAPRTGIPTSTKTSASETGRTTRTPSPGVSTFKSTFSLFARRTKTATEVAETEKKKKKEKSTRKGPAAGTGHEGYGRVGAVKRRSSNASNLPRASSESPGITQSTDPFLLERMNPVIIAGGEIVENRNSSSKLARTESNQTIPMSRASIDSRNASSASLSSREDARYTLWPSPLPRASVKSRRPSDSSDSEAVAMKSTIAFRRSTRGLQSPGHAPFGLPKPINTRAPSAASMATTIFTDDSMPESLPEPDRGLHDPSNPPKKLTKRAKSPRKWNLFGRSQTSTKDKKQVEAKVATANETVQSKPVAFYTMMDSSEQEEEQDVAAILREAQIMPAHETSAHGRSRRPSTGDRPIDSSQNQGSTSVTPRLNALPVRKPPAPKPESHQECVGDGNSTSTASRPSRLPQVGRIPKVLNSRLEQTSAKSFSRPFHRISVQFPPPQLDRVDPHSVAKGPSPTNAPRSDIAPEPTSKVAKVPSSSGQGELLGQGPTPEIGKEFLSFSPHNNSVCTTSTDSCSSGVGLSLDHTAVLPEPAGPLGEDEVWDEYNDLLGDPPLSATSSRGVPFHLESYETNRAESSTKPLVSPTLTTQLAKDVRDSIETGRSASSSHYSADMTARLNAAFKFGNDQPATPFSVSEFVSGYGDRNKGNALSSQERVQPQRNSASSNQSVKANSSHHRSSGSSRNSDETPLSQVNLRVGSMTVSKWLTFGHVLFSPVREDLVNVVGSLKRHSILVIDGLGNDDWSFYAAETYPAATFFNLSPRAPIPQEHQSSSSFPLSPPNHHQIQFTSHMDKFPFGPESFTSIVFRFPAAAPEAHYRNIISEARRVLKPGGFIELAILDVDLNNMGNRTRRSVRRLKERVTTRNPDLNLSSTADLILRLLGKKGFVDIKNCRVGVPVASSITHSSSVDGKKDERSLAEMMSDETEKGDENITKMVSKVGRWWYNRCYEVPTGMPKSIWNNRALLAECEEWGTSLKLMVCHARMPVARGRVASV